MRYFKIPRFISGYTAITLAPIGIFIIAEKFNDETIRNHERIHWDQQKRDFYIGFYIRYLVEWIRKGYRDVSYEKEAYTFEGVSNYAVDPFIWAADKLKHYKYPKIASQLLTAFGVWALACQSHHWLFRWWIPLSFLALVLVAAGKELIWDKLLGLGKPDWDDFIASLLGIVHGLLIIYPHQHR